VLRKTKERLGALYGKNSQFKVDFHRIMNQMLTKEEFEGAWIQMLSTYALEKNPYLYQIYETRDKWAKPYFRILCEDDQYSTKRKCEPHVEDIRAPPGSAMHVFVKKLTNCCTTGMQKRASRRRGLVW
jgi:hypothetical protein